MLLAGLEKTTLSDFPGRIACIVFLVNCNFKCIYCHNKELTSFKFFKKSGRKLIPEEDFFSFLDKKKKMLDGVVITGGEPTCSPGLIPFLKKIKKKGFEIKLDTNGSNPRLLEEIIRKNLVDYIAMDLKAPLKKYSKLIRSKISKKRLKESIEILKASKIPHEFRTTLYPKLLIKDFEEMSLLIPGEKWFLQEFIPKNAFEPSVRRMKPFPEKKLEKILKKLTNNNIILRK